MKKQMKILVFVISIFIIAVTVSGCGGSDNNTATEEPATTTTEEADTPSAPEEEATAEESTPPTEEPAPPTEEPAPTPEEPADNNGDFNEADYKVIPWEDLQRKPDDYLKQKVKMEGFVLQNEVPAETWYGEAVFDGFVTTMVVDENGEQVVVIGWESKTIDERILANDVITVYGTFEGTEQYQSALGTLESVPGVVVTKFVREE
jgi:hypothetical protein